MSVMGTVGKGGCIVAGAALEGGAIGLQAVGSVMVAVGTGFIRAGNKTADGSAWFYEKANIQHRPVRLLTSVDEINRELEEAEKRFTEFYEKLTSPKATVPEKVESTPEQKPVVDSEVSSLILDPEAI